MTRIGIDAWLALTHAPGLGRYARELVRALAALPECPELALFEVGPGARVLPEAALGLAGARTRVRRLRLRLPRRSLDLAARLTGTGAERWLGGVDLFHRVLAHSPPVRDVPQTAPVFELPPRGSPAERRLGDALAGLAAVVVASRHAAEAVAERFPAVAGRIERVRVGCDHWRREWREGPRRDGAPRVLVLGALARRRAPLAVLAAVESLHAGGRAVELVFAGGPGDAAADLERAVGASPARGAVTWIDHPRETDLPGLVASASVLVHLADEELTAVTPLEAFSLGAAVVASRLPAFEEDLGGLATFAEGRDAPALADAIERELARAGDGERSAARMRHAAEYTWEAQARATIELWQRLLGG